MAPETLSQLQASLRMTRRGCSAKQPTPLAADYAFLAAVVTAGQGTSKA